MRAVLAVLCVLVVGSTGWGQWQINSVHRRVEAVDGALTRMRDSFDVPTSTPDSLFVQVSPDAWADQYFAFDHGICARTDLGAMDGLTRASGNFFVTFTIPEPLEVTVTYNIEGNHESPFTFIGAGVSVSTDTDLFYERLMVPAGGYRIQMDVSTTDGSRLVHGCVSPFVIPEPSTYAVALGVIAALFFFRRRHR